MIIGNMKPCPFCGRVIDTDTSRIEINLDRDTMMKMRFTCLCGITFEIEDDELYYDNRGMPHQLGRTAFDKWNARVESQTEREGE